jgi:hypothetical protein
MPSPQLVCTQIEQLIGYLIEVGLSSDQNYPFVRQRPDRMVEVNFPKSDYLSIALKNRSYAEIYENLSSERAYITKLPDGALVTMRYLYNSNELERHSLGFYPSPNLEEFQNSPEIYLEDIVYADVIARNIVPFPIRFDFDCREDVFIPVHHPKSHLTLGQYQNCRIPIAAPLTPYCFISFLLRNFYNTAFNQYSDQLPFFSEVFENSIHPEELKIANLQMPVERVSFIKPG